MKLYLKLNNFDIYRNIESLLYKNTVIVPFLNQEIPVEYKIVFESLQQIKNNKFIFFQHSTLKSLIKGIYFGNDSCEHLMPNFREIVEVYNFCRIHKWNFVFVFPPISENQITNAKEIILFLEDLIEKEVEIVANDYGILNLLISSKKIKPILGIHLIKRIKPVFVEHIDCKSLSSQKELLNHIEIEVDILREFYKKNGISRFSIENIDTDLSFIKSSPYFYADFYYPYIRISTSRVCNIAGLFNDKRNFFPDKKCIKYCKKIGIEFKNSIAFKIFQRYNTIFTTNFNLNLPKELYAKKRNRLIWEIFL